MLTFLFTFPETPVFMISLASFVLSVLLATVLDVAQAEIRFYWRLYRLRRQGYEHEAYLEARFVMRPTDDPDTVLAELAEKFKLTITEEWTYDDVYYKNSLPILNGRKPKVRIRCRTRDDRQVKSSQVLFTHSVENKGELDQFRYFVAAKTKLYRTAEVPTPPNCASEARPNIKFRRRFAKGGDAVDLFISVDRVDADQPFYILEIKTYADRNLLRQAMRYVMMEYSPELTTHSKLGLVRLTGQGSLAYGVA
jgi:hypothetical protein